MSYGMRHGVIRTLTLAYGVRGLYYLHGQGGQVAYTHGSHFTAWQGGGVLVYFDWRRRLRMHGWDYGHSSPTTDNIYVHYTTTFGMA